MRTRLLLSRLSTQAKPPPVNEECHRASGGAANAPDVVFAKIGGNRVYHTIDEAIRSLGGADRGAVS